MVDYEKSHWQSCVHLTNLTKLCFTLEWEISTGSAMHVLHQTCQKMDLLISTKNHGIITPIRSSLVVPKLTLQNEADEKVESEYQE